MRECRKEREGAVAQRIQKYPPRLSAQGIGLRPEKQEAVGKNARREIQIARSVGLPIGNRRMSGGRTTAV